MDMAGLDENFKSMIGEQLDIQGKKAADRSRANPKKRLQYLAAGTAGATAPQETGYGAITKQGGEIVTAALWGTSEIRIIILVVNFTIIT